MYIYPCWRCSLYSVQEHCALPALFDSARKVLQQHTHSNGFQASLLSWWTKCLRTGMWTWKWLTGVRAKFLCVCLNDSGPGFGVWSYYSETKVFIHIQYDFFLKDHSIFPVGCLVNWTTECQFAGENLLWSYLQTFWSGLLSRWFIEEFQRQRIEDAGMDKGVYKTSVIREKWCLWLLLVIGFPEQVKNEVSIKQTKLEMPAYASCMMLPSVITMI